MSYELGLNKIYNSQEIELEKNQPYFNREFRLFYNVGVGNVFLENTLQYADQLEIQYRDRPYNSATQKALGIDLGFGSSKTAFTIIELVDNIVHVIYSKQFANSSTELMVRHANDRIIKYDLLNPTNKIFVDGSASGFIRSIKYQVGESMNYEYIIEKARVNGRQDQLYHYMQIVPINFSTHGKSMLENVKRLLDRGVVAIDPKF